MSEESSESAYRSSVDATLQDPMRRLRHDLRHSLYVFDLAVTLLDESRADPERFSEVLDMLRQEQKSVTALVDELLAHMSGKGLSHRKGE